MQYFSLAGVSNTRAAISSYTEIFAFRRYFKLAWFTRGQLTLYARSLLITATK